MLKTRAVLGRGQVQAIQHLVAAAVASLTPDRVAIVDDRGNLLAGGDDKTGADATAANQDQNTTDYEDRLRQRVESIVASVVGAGPCPRPGHRRHELQPHQHDRESYDPDSKVVRSTQTVEQNATDTTGAGARRGLGRQRPARRSQRPRGGDNGKSNSGRTEETTNYEISKTVTTSHRRRRRRQEAVGRRGGRRHRRRGADLQAAQRRRR